MIIELTSKDFDEKTRTGSVVVLFYSSSNGKDSEGLIKLASEGKYAEEVKFAMVDVDKSPELAKRYGAAVFPATLVMRSGIVKKLSQMVYDPVKVAAEVAENACYSRRVSMGRSQVRANNRVKR
ncbi:MAG TPA: thioredoxin family protein [bacterium]|nr:thioredoxin family protein [bacterium]